MLAYQTGLETAVDHFYFDLVEDGEVIADPEGRRFADLAAARRAAIAAIRDLLCAAVARGELPLHHILEIRDARHTVIQRIPFSEAVNISLMQI